DPKEAQTVLGALSGAGTPEALSAIQNIATDRSGKPEVREAALGHLGLHDEPTAETVKTLSKVVATESDQVLKNQAIISLGDAAGRLAMNPKTSADDSALAKQEIAGLTEQLQAAKDPQSQTLYLQALGNARGATGATATADYLNSTDPTVRQAAIFAQRFVAGEQADKAIIGALLRDGDPTLRGTAAQAASFRQFNPTLLAGVTEGLKTESEGLVRGSMVECLGAYLPQAPAEVRKLLESVSANDADAQVRDSAAKILKAAPGMDNAPPHAAQ
ncbi:MAG TPA: HEAT repeat domain-containing protein, partial [Polyangiaceae bacterium]